MAVRQLDHPDSTQTFGLGSVFAEFRFLANLLLFYTLLSLFTPLHASKLCQKILKKIAINFLVFFLINLGILHVNFDQRNFRKLFCIAHLFSSNFCWKNLVKKLAKFGESS
jgi:hypothetical protein